MHADLNRSRQDWDFKAVIAADLHASVLKAIPVALQISDVIKDHSAFAKDLDWSARPGTKTYPRWKDALIGCFKVSSQVPIDLLT